MDIPFPFALKRPPPVDPASTFDSHTYDTPLPFVVPPLRGLRVALNCNLILYNKSLLSHQGFEFCL
jgi:hypothetical protein